MRGSAALRSWVGETLTGWVPPGQPFELARAGKWRLIPSRPAVSEQEGIKKQLKIPDFPFHLAEGWGNTGEETDKLRGAAPPLRTAQGLVQRGDWPCPSIPSYFGTLDC